MQKTRQNARMERGTTLFSRGRNSEAEDEGTQVVESSAETLRQQCPVISEIPPFPTKVGLQCRTGDGCGFELVMVDGTAGGNSH